MVATDPAKKTEEKTEEKTGAATATGNNQTIEEQLASIEHTLTEQAALQAANNNKDPAKTGAGTTDEPGTKPASASASNENVDAAKLVAAVSSQNEEILKELKTLRAERDEAQIEIRSLKASQQFFQGRPFMEKMMQARKDAGVPPEEIEVFAKSMFGLSTEDIKARYLGEQALHASNNKQNAQANPYGVNPDVAKQTVVREWERQQFGGQNQQTQVQEGLPFNGQTVLADVPGESALMAATKKEDGTSKTLEEMLGNA